MARELKPGERRPLIMKMLGGTNGSFGRVLVNARTTGHPLHDELAEIGRRSFRVGTARARAEGGRFPFSPGSKSQALTLY